MENSTNEIALTLPAAVRVLMLSGQVEEMKLETYLAGAVAAEIGVTAPLEALKAQAVASRTYVGSAERHREQHADVCITGHCQKWKRVDPVTAPEVFRALSETWGMVAVHDGKLINAFFFEHCDGHTRNAEEMLIPAAEYLRGVDCSCGHLTLKGHGVGMCKRGAIVMARRGASFVQILRHYYRGVVVMRMAAEKPVTPDIAEAKPSHAPETPKKPRARKIVQEPNPLTRKRAMVKLRPRPRITIHPETQSPPVTQNGRTPLKKPTLPLPSTPPEEITVSTQPAIQEAEKYFAASISPLPIEPAPSQEENTQAMEPTTPTVVEQLTSQVDASKPLTQPQAETFAAVEIEPAVVEQPTPSVETSTVLAQPQAEMPVPVDTAPAVVEQPTPATQVSMPLAQAETPAPVEIVPVVETPPLASPVPEHTLLPLERVQVKLARRMHVDHLPGPRMIAGSLARAGIVVSIENGNGNQTLVFSGSAPHYGEGGFETLVDEDGTYRVSIEGETIQIEIREETAFIHAT